MNEDDFLIFIENFIPKIKYIRFIKDIEATSNEKIHKFLRALIYFENQDSADNFYYEYSTKSYPINKFEFLYCVFVDKIIFEQVNYKLTAQNIKKLYIPIVFDPYKEQSEIFCCPLCLEKLDSASTGIHTVANLTNCKRWEDFKNCCKICSKIKNCEIHSDEDISLRMEKNILEIENNNDILKCLKCKENNLGNWCCMICGFSGCDRYQLGHAVEHFNNTLHRYSIDLISQRIWDYLGDSWVHRLITLTNPSHSVNNPSSGHNTHNNTIFLENENTQTGENLNTKEFLTRVENIISEYNYVLAMQLEEQRKYYEKEINKLNENHENKNKNKIAKLNAIKDEINKKRNLMDLHKKLYSECNKKMIQQEKRMAEMKENINFNKELITNIKIDLKSSNESVEAFSSKLDLEYEIKKKKRDELEKELNELYNKLSNK